MKRTFLIGSVLGVGLMGLVGCGSGGTAASTPKTGSTTPASPNSTPTGSPSAGGKFGPGITKLIAQAKQEGHLNLLWSAEFLDNGKDLPAFQKAFNQYYGLNISMSFTPGPSMPQVASEIVQAAKAGTPAPTDVWMEDSGPMHALISGKATLTYPWASLGNDLHINVPSEAIGPGNIGVAFGTNIYVIGYNPKTVPKSEVPSSYQDLLNPKWKGKIASNVYASGFYQLAAAGNSWGYQKTLNFVQQFSHQIGGLVRCGDLNVLLSGQYDIIAPECSTQTFIFAQRKGQQVGYVVPSDGPAIDELYTGVPKTAKDPAAAALLTLFMVTPEGQQLSWQENAYDLNWFPNSHAAQLLKPLLDKKVVIPNPLDYMNNPNISKYQKQFIQILTHPTGGK